MLEFPEMGTIIASEKSIKEQLSYCYNEGKKNGAIEELEHLKAVIRFNGLYNEQIEDLIDIEIKGWKGE